MADAGGLMQTAPPTAKGRATRQTILAAAEEVFGELSYDSASIAEITRRAGVAQGTFYVYFPDKRAAFVELVHQLNHDLRKAIAIATTDVADRLSVEGIGLRTFFDYVSKHRSLYRIVRESQFVAPETYEWHYSTLADGYVRGIAAAQESGEITSAMSADTVAWILMGIAEMLGGRWILLMDRQPPDDVFDEIMLFISGAISQKGAGV